MTAIWLFTASDHTGTIDYYVAVESDDKAEVGKFVKENPEKFGDLFEFMEYCSYMGGKVYDVLYPDKGSQYPNLDVKQALSTIPDDKIFDEFWAYDKDSESTAVNTLRIPKEKIVKLS